MVLLFEVDGVMRRERLMQMTNGTLCDLFGRRIRLLLLQPLDVGAPLIDKSAAHLPKQYCYC